jgi:hypothetical protein
LALVSSLPHNREKREGSCGIKGMMDKEDERNGYIGRASYN